MNRAAALFLGVLIALPLLGASASAMQAALNWQAWQAMLGDSQWLPAAGMTLWTGLASTAITVAATAWLLSRSFPGPLWQAAVKILSPMLAVPHAAFAIGLAFLVAPSGWLLRAMSPWATGFESPPAWQTTQDPWGLGLIAVLVAKEVPFLLWAAATQLQRADVSARWTRELDIARSMGYAPYAAWWRVVWPQLWPRLTAPLAAVLAYSLTVVDVGLVIGPASTPTLAVLAWQWLLDADVHINTQGAAAGWALAAIVGALVAVFWMVHRTQYRKRGAASSYLANGRRGKTRLRGGILKTLKRLMPLIPIFPLLALVLLYAAVMLALAVGSVSGVWPFPDFWPQNLSLNGWHSVMSSSDTLWTTLSLAAASSLAALLWSVAWLEMAPAAWDRQLRRLVYLPLVLPPVLWVVGLYRISLAWGIDARWTGLWLAHSLAAAPYVLIALSPAYLGFDARYAHIAASLRKSRFGFLLHIKWPLLKASLLAAFAVGFAVSVAQYLPTLFIGAGRFATVTTEAVTLASGGQRSLTASYAWLQWLLPALVFALAAALGRPRRFARAGP